MIKTDHIQNHGQREKTKTTCVENMSLLCLIHELSYEEIFAHKTRLIPSEDFALINEIARD